MYMPVGHGKRWSNVRKSLFFLHDKRKIDAKFYPNDSTWYFTITKEGHELVQKILHDSNTRDVLAICGINTDIFDDYKNSLANIISPQLQQVSIEQVIKL